MKDTTKQILEELVIKYPQLSVAKNDILNAYLLLENAYKNGNKLLICGNGGSAADSEHIVGELMKKFKKERPIKQDIYNEPIVIITSSTFSEYLYNCISHNVRDIDYTDFDEIIMNNLGTDVSRKISDLTLEKFGACA